MLFNIYTQSWDEELLRLFDIPNQVLPEVLDCSDNFADVKIAGLQGLKVAGVAGDQQAALIGQGCFAPGMAKSTYGTGCFLIMNTGAQPLKSSNRLLTTVGYRLNGETSYALEGSIFIAGAAIQWLRDGLGIIEKASQSEALARSVDGNGGVYLVPAFAGLGAPYWDPYARGAIVGLTRGSGVGQICRAALESVAYQTRDLVEAMRADGVEPRELRVDGGMVGNDLVVQFLADMLHLTVTRPQITETTALGAATNTSATPSLL